MILKKMIYLKLIQMRLLQCDVKYSSLNSFVLEKENNVPSNRRYFVHLHLVAATGDGIIKSYRWSWHATKCRQRIWIWFGKYRRCPSISSRTWTKTRLQCKTKVKFSLFADRFILHKCQYNYQKKTKERTTINVFKLNHFFTAPTTAIMVTVFQNEIECHVKHKPFMIIVTVIAPEKRI